jgi:hypothetical protein
VITAACTVNDGQSKTFRRGEVVEASATSAAGGRSPSQDDTGEPVGVSNGGP